MSENKGNGKSLKTLESFILNTPDLVCFSHLRWNFVYQRPQHLLSRCARERSVFFVEEPIFGEGEARLELSQPEERLTVVVPHLPRGLDKKAVNKTLQTLINEMFTKHKIHTYISWYYTPMALNFTRHLKPVVVVYDCMDELTLFKGASPALKKLEVELFSRADIVFTGGQSLYEVKRNQHPNVHLFPSSIDVAHFAQARNPVEEPADQANIPHPRLGFFGVIDERFDVNLLAGLAQARPDWHLVIIGPVVKIDRGTLPHRDNIHYLGSKSYQDLPVYLSGWDVALLPFALNDATRFISPTKTPEYLAGGKRVVSTSVTDVVRPYQEQQLVRIADTVPEFVAAVEASLAQSAAQTATWLQQVDQFLAKKSWDRTWGQMAQLIQAVLDSYTLKAPTLPSLNGPLADPFLAPALLNSFQLEEFFASVAEPRAEIRTSEDVVVSKVGQELYEKFFRHYTRKQWNLDPSELDSSVIARVPIRTNRDDRYFTDTYQSMPLFGYTRMFENMLDHRNIKIMLNTDYREIKEYVSSREIIYSGPVDEYFNFCYGKLPYRSLQFRFETLNMPFHQPVAVINYPNQHPYTRVTEFKHLTGQDHPQTSLVYEYPSAEGDPYYPIPRSENADLYRKYKALADVTPDVHFVGRLATYKYYNMDQVTVQALTLYAKISGVSRAESIKVQATAAIYVLNGASTAQVDRSAS